MTVVSHHFSHFVQEFILLIPLRISSGSLINCAFTLLLPHEYPLTERATCRPGFLEKDSDEDFQGFLNTEPGMIPANTLGPIQTNKIQFPSEISARQ